MHGSGIRKFHNSNSNVSLMSFPPHVSMGAGSDLTPTFVFLILDMAMLTSFPVRDYLLHRRSSTVSRSHCESSCSVDWQYPRGHAVNSYKRKRTQYIYVSAIIPMLCLVRDDYCFFYTSITCIFVILFPFWCSVHCSIGQFLCDNGLTRGHYDTE